MYLNILHRNANMRLLCVWEALFPLFSMESTVSTDQSRLQFLIAFACVVGGYVRILRLTVLYIIIYGVEMVVLLLRCELLLFDVWQPQTHDTRLWMGLEWWKAKSVMPIYCSFPLPLLTSCVAMWPRRMHDKGRRARHSSTNGLHQPTIHYAQTNNIQRHWRKFELSEVQTFQIL